MNDAVNEERASFLDTSDSRAGLTNYQYVTKGDDICETCACSYGRKCFTDGTDGTSESVASSSRTDIITSHPQQGLGSKLTPFNMKWTYGFNFGIAVLNLSKRGSSLICYAASHAAVLYNFEEESMHHLHGHKNAVKCLSADKTGRWIAVADSGEDNICTIWDCNTLIPLHTIVSVDKEDPIAAVGLSPDAKYCVVVQNGDVATISLNLWTLANESSVGVAEVKLSGAPIKVAFHLANHNKMMIAFEKQVAFLKWDEEKSDFDQPVIPMIRNKKHMGTITDCSYIQSSDQAVAVSTEGCILVFGTTLYTPEENEEEVPGEMVFIKMIKIAAVPINCVTTVDKMVVTGDSRGLIRFFDRKLRILYWYENPQMTAVRSVAFDLETKTYDVRDAADFDLDESLTPPTTGRKEDYYEDRTDEFEIIYKNMVPSDCTLRKAPFVVRDFIASTFDGNIYRIKYLDNKCIPLLSPADDVVAGIDTHDEKPFLCIAYANGRISLYNFLSNEKILEHVLPEVEVAEDEEEVKVTYIKYSPRSLHLACSRSNGDVWMLDQVILEPKYDAPLHGSRYKIVKMIFSADAKYLAYYDVQRTVCLFKYSIAPGTWEFIGKVRAHPEPIHDILFSPYVPQRLFTLGEDRKIVEYNPECEPGKFTAISIDRIQQTSIPVTFIYDPEEYPNQESYFIITDNQFKYKKYNDKTLLCHSVALGPHYACYNNSPVYKISVIQQQDRTFMLYGTEKHIGMQLFPIDGNPYKYIALVAHPQKLKDFCTSKDGKYLFTIGENDRAVMMWTINIGAVDVLHKVGGNELEPFYTLIEGGRTGWLFSEMQDLFYYMQILHQGENTMLPRVVSDYIPITELPDLMRACGFYLSEYEADDLLADIRLREFDETGCERHDVSFEEFVMLYINHRPAHGICLSELQEAFQDIVQTADEPTRESIDKNDFIDTICSQGEPFEVHDANECLSVLMRHETEYEEVKPSFSYLPEELNFETFLDEILGLDLQELNAQGITIDIFTPRGQRTPSNISSDY